MSVKQKAKPKAPRRVAAKKAAKKTARRGTVSAKVKPKARSVKASVKATAKAVAKPKARPAISPASTWRDKLYFGCRKRVRKMIRPRNTARLMTTSNGMLISARVRAYRAYTIPADSGSRDHG